MRTKGMPVKFELKKNLNLLRDFYLQFNTISKQMKEKSHS